MFTPMHMFELVGNSQEVHADWPGLQHELRKPMPRYRRGIAIALFRALQNYCGLIGNGVSGPRTEGVLRGSTAYAPPRSLQAPHVAGHDGRDHHDPPVGLLPADRPLVYMLALIRTSRHDGAGCSQAQNKYELHGIPSQELVVGQLTEPAVMRSRRHGSEHRIIRREWRSPSTRGA